MSKKDSFVSFKKLLTLRIFLYLLIAAGIVLRLIFFRGQVWLGSDITRDIAISLEAINRLEIPQTGSFSSAGPFVFGPTLYWLYIISFLVFPFSLLTPWYAASITGVLIIVAFYGLAKKIGNSYFIILTVAMASLSPQMILTSSSPTQHAYVLVFTLLSLIFLYAYFRRKSIVWSFLAGISIGIALNMHYQALYLLILPLIVLFLRDFTLKRKFFGILTILLGALVVLLPLLIWDSGQSFANIRNLFDYLLIGQERIYVPNSWKLYVFEYMPGYFAFVTGIPSFLGLIILAGGSVATLYELIKYKNASYVVLLNVILFLMLFIGRFYRGERFPGYTIYMLPFLIIFFAWTLSRFIDLVVKSLKNTRIGKYFIIAILITLIVSTLYQLKGKSNENPSFRDVKSIVEKLSNEYPGRKFRVLNFTGINPDASYAVAAYLEHEDLYTLNEPVYIGFCNGCPESTHELGELFGTSYMIIGGNEINDNWHGVSQSEIYDSTIGWLNKHQLKSTFSLEKYIFEKISKI